ncbi:conserved hypothetical protein [Candida tropicalis MYA-3404]|uniref:Uncharacterized protein n=1 Tax=Candida tropicalis (strain ATCC MYA-3404 / T1) TaxID=294747 RepID=C5MA64_CANTT|nr:conserved hypothetical protein [Candida tropicalis MYA-3404]EER33558.1 conserved hypothetical protein [Candida tropicalis MYA-3404]KAG4407398.1 hypothetical protein JTP64_002933 [Candida tropicalis]MCP8719412.1 hypothetical protein [Asgard group archaeon]
MFITLFRIGNLILLGSGLARSLATKLPPHIVKAGHLQFITNCSLLTTVIYLISTFFHISPWFYNLACNLEFNVIVSYWTMALFFSSMVAEADVDRDLFLDLQVHAFPYIYLIIDNQPTIDLKTSWISTLTFVFLYWVYIEWECGKHIHDGVSGFPYPFMKGLNRIQRFGCISVFASIACFNYFVLSLRNMF